MYDEDYINIEAEIVEPAEQDFIPVTPNAFQMLNDTAQFCSTNFTTNLTICNGTEIFMKTDYSSIERVVAIVVPILFGIIVIVGLIGNTLVVIVVACNPQMRSTTNVLIINLAVADLLFIMFCVPFTAFDYALPYWPFGDIWCRVVQYLVIVCAYASIYTLVLMSLDRFLAVVHPITSMSIRTVQNACIAIGVMWAVIVLACIPALQSHGQIYYTYQNIEYSVCMFLSTEGYNYAAYQICFFLSSYIVPLSLIFVLYVLMLKRLWFGVAPGGRVSAESLKSKKRVTRMVVIVVVIFAVCWCPIQIVLVLKSVNSYGITPIRIVIQISAHILAYMNSCVNPILYAFLSDNFRKAFHKVIACHKKQSALPNRNNQENRTERETTLNNGTSKLTGNNTSNDIM
ncbi:allatostatin-A receptor-like [Argiope bruennichi]|uniref:Allatostatin-A receptor like protein n=1 Tax=Argiope bruennichi TaxID=94029 RepID=A0A8T0EVD2_ARGBR|nr:allatostatin-A receptor-like [Argiope bruennichi]XP_055934568.1 allatostatin-A receptor-like [Argiope bruennichi]KAF8782276.1 Allatostatin-A receptor like protein [Argiope bruennichi]